MATGSGTGTPITSTPTTESSSALGLGRLSPLPRTLLGHNRYAEIMQITLPHFNQMAGAQAPITTGCDGVWDHTARYALCLTILRAERMIAELLGYWPSPKFIENETQQFGNQSRIKPYWYEAPLQTRWKYVQSYGTEQLDVVARGVPVSYHNLDNDPLDRKETAIIGGSSLYSFLAACDNLCDVAVFFRPSDGATDEADPRWEIRPLIIDIDDPDMTIRGESSFFVKPTLWRLTEKEANNTEDWIIDFDEGNLVSEVDVFCRVTNTTLPACLKWNYSCSCASTAWCTHSSQSACARGEDDENGWFTVQPATGANEWTSPLFGTPPNHIKINYRAGYPLDPYDCRMDSSLETAIVKLTNVLLPTPPCEYCDAARVRWIEDRTNIDPLTVEAANMPWAIYQRGALEAWRIVKLFLSEGGGLL